MGTLHKFKRSPKNEKQFRGYRPDAPQSRGAKWRARLTLGGWQASVLAWLALVLVAVGIWAVSALFGSG